MFIVHVLVPGMESNISIVKFQGWFTLKSGCQRDHKHWNVHFGGSTDFEPWPSQLL